MGSEFLTRTKRTIEKSVDRNRVALATPDLLTNTPHDQPRCSIASLANGVTVSDGEVLIVESRNGSLTARRGNSIIANFDNPSSDLIAAIGNSGGAASGIVRRVHKISKKAEVALC